MFAAVASGRSEETAPRMWQSARRVHHRQSSPPQYIAKSLRPRCCAAPKSHVFDDTQWHRMISTQDCRTISSHHHATVSPDVADELVVTSTTLLPRSWRTARTAPLIQRGLCLEYVGVTLPQTTTYSHAINTTAIVWGCVFSDSVVQGAVTRTVLQL